MQLFNCYDFLGPKLSSKVAYLEGTSTKFCSHKATLLETNILLSKACLKMIFLFQRWGTVSSLEAIVGRWFPGPSFQWRICTPVKQTWRHLDCSKASKADVLRRRRLDKNAMILTSEGITT